MPEGAQFGPDADRAPGTVLVLEPQGFVRAPRRRCLDDHDDARMALSGPVASPARSTPAHDGLGANHEECRILKRELGSPLEQCTEPRQSQPKVRHPRLLCGDRAFRAWEPASNESDRTFVALRSRCREDRVRPLEGPEQTALPAPLDPGAPTASPRRYSPRGFARLRCW